MPRSGTLVICVQNLDYSGANQVVLNIVSGRMHESNVVVLSPTIGAFAARFVDSGAAIRIGNISNILNEIRDVFCIICNTIMTANTVVDMAKRPQPVIWILHEWWDDKMIQENLAIRNMKGLTLETVRSALSQASMIIFVCESQRNLYKPTAQSKVIYVGVPAPLPESVEEKLKLRASSTDTKVFTFLTLGIICPRKNQVWAVKLFKQFAGSRTDVRLLIVGARYTRQYEIEYLEEVKAAATGDARIQIHDVTSNVDQFYMITDCLLFTSVNEVTPMVISEAMSWSIPVLSTNIAGIPEMITDGQEGFLFQPNDDVAALKCMHLLTDPSYDKIRIKMGQAGLRRYEAMFDLDIMVDAYRQVVLQIAPPTILVDMDGVLVDWDKGFRIAWDNRSTIDRSKSYFMEQCVSAEFKRQAELLILSEGFFENLPPMTGGLDGIREMVDAGYRVLICTSPVMTSRYCAQEKLNWIRNNLGEVWLDKVIICLDKSSIRGDILLDDKPFEHLAPGGKHTTATWKQVVFDAPYNRQKIVPRLFEWQDWKEVIIPLLGRTPTVDPYALEFGEPVSEQINRMSLRFKRNQLRIKAGVVAQHMQDMYLGAIYPDVMTPEDVASVAGTGSLFVEDEDIQKALNAVEGLKESAVNDVEFERILSNERAMWLNRMSSYVQFIPSSQRVIDESNVNPPNPLPSTQVIQLEEEVKAEPKVTPTSLVSSECSDFRRGYRSWRSKAVSSASKDPSKPTASSSAKEKN